MANSIKIGDKDLVKAYYGSVEVSKIYLGEIQLYSASSQKLDAPTNVTINGTTVSWGKVQNATSYDIYVDGALYTNINIGTETWLLNESLVCESKTYEETFNINFTSNNQKYTSLYVKGNNTFITTDLTGCVVKYGDTDVYIYSNWQNTAYRTITFDEPVTDATLLAWLQLNGTKQ